MPDSSGPVLQSSFSRSMSSLRHALERCPVYHFLQVRGEAAIDCYLQAVLTENDISIVKSHLERRESR
jgi:hypothetical protein